MAGVQPEAARMGSLGLTEGLVVQEIGWDDDVDENLRDDIMDAIDGDLIEDAVEAVDVVWLWLRDDVDVVDALVDALRDLGPQGFVLAATPKVGRPGFVDAADMVEGAQTAGLALTTTQPMAPDWVVHKFVRPRSARR